MENKPSFTIENFDKAGMEKSFAEFDKKYRNKFPILDIKVNLYPYNIVQTFTFILPVSLQPLDLSYVKSKNWMLQRRDGRFIWKSSDDFPDLPKRERRLITSTALLGGLMEIFDKVSDVTQFCTFAEIFFEQIDLEQMTTTQVKKLENAKESIPCAELDKLLDYYRPIKKKF